MSGGTTDVTTETTSTTTMPSTTNAPTGPPVDPLTFGGNTNPNRETIEGGEQREEGEGAEQSGVEESNIEKLKNLASLIKIDDPYTFNADEPEVEIEGSNFAVTENAVIWGTVNNVYTSSSGCAMALRSWTSPNPTGEVCSVHGGMSTIWNVFRPPSYQKIVQWNWSKTFEQAPIRKLEEDRFLGESTLTIQEGDAGYEERGGGEEEKEEDRTHVGHLQASLPIPFHSHKKRRTLTEGEEDEEEEKEKREEDEDYLDGYDSGVICTKVYPFAKTATNQIQTFPSQTTVFTTCITTALHTHSGLPSRLELSSPGKRAEFFDDFLVVAVGESMRDAILLHALKRAIGLSPVVAGFVFSVHPRQFNAPDAKLGASLANFRDFVYVSPNMFAQLQITQNRAKAKGNPTKEFVKNAFIEIGILALLREANSFLEVGTILMNKGSDRSDQTAATVSDAIFGSVLEHLGDKNLWSTLFGHYRFGYPVVVQTPPHMSSEHLGDTLETWPAQFSRKMASNPSKFGDNPPFVAVIADSTLESSLLGTLKNVSTLGSKLARRKPLSEGWFDPFFRVLHGKIKDVLDIGLRERDRLDRAKRALGLDWDANDGAPDHSDIAFGALVSAVHVILGAWLNMHKERMIVEGLDLKVFEAENLAEETMGASRKRDMLRSGAESFGAHQAALQFATTATKSMIDEDGAVHWFFVELTELMKAYDPNDTKSVWGFCERFAQFAMADLQWRYETIVEISSANRRAHLNEIGVLGVLKGLKRHWDGGADVWFEKNVNAGGSQPSFATWLYALHGMREVTFNEDILSGFLSKSDFYSIYRKVPSAWSAFFSGTGLTLESLRQQRSRVAQPAIPPNGAALLKLCTARSLPLPSPEGGNLTYNSITQVIEHGRFGEKGVVQERNRSAHGNTWKPFSVQLHEGTFRSKRPKRNPPMPQKKQKIAIPGQIFSFKCPHEYVFLTGEFGLVQSIPPSSIDDLFLPLKGLEVSRLVRYRPFDFERIEKYSGEEFLKDFAGLLRALEEECRKLSKLEQFFSPAFYRKRLALALELEMVECALESGNLGESNTSEFGVTGEYRLEWHRGPDYQGVLTFCGNADLFFCPLTASLTDYGYGSEKDKTSVLKDRTFPVWGSPAAGNSKDPDGVYSLWLVTDQNPGAEMLANVLDGNSGIIESRVADSFVRSQDGPALTNLFESVSAADAKLQAMTKSEQNLFDRLVEITEEKSRNPSSDLPGGARRSMDFEALPAYGLMKVCALTICREKEPLLRPDNLPMPDFKPYVSSSESSSEWLLAEGSELPVVELDAADFANASIPISSAVATLKYCEPINRFAVPFGGLLQKRSDHLQKRAVVRHDSGRYLLRAYRKFDLTSSEHLADEGRNRWWGYFGELLGARGHVQQAGIGDPAFRYLGSFLRSAGAAISQMRGEGTRWATSGNAQEFGREFMQEIFLKSENVCGLCPWIKAAFSLNLEGALVLGGTLHSLDVHLGISEHLHELQEIARGMQGGLSMRSNFALVLTFDALRDSAPTSFAASILKSDFPEISNGTTKYAKLWLPWFNWNPTEFEQNMFWVMERTPANASFPTVCYSSHLQLRILCTDFDTNLTYTHDVRPNDVRTIEIVRNQRRKSLVGNLPTANFGKLGAWELSEALARCIAHRVVLSCLQKERYRVLDGRVLSFRDVPFDFALWNLRSKFEAMNMFRNKKPKKYPLGKLFNSLADPEKRLLKPARKSVQLALKKMQERGSFRRNDLGQPKSSWKEYFDFSLGSADSLHESVKSFYLEPLAECAFALRSTTASEETCDILKSQSVFTAEFLFFAREFTKTGRGISGYEDGGFPVPKFFGTSFGGVPWEIMEKNILRECVRIIDAARQMGWLNPFRAKLEDIDFFEKLGNFPEAGKFPLRPENAVLQANFKSLQGGSSRRFGVLGVDSNGKPNIKAESVSDDREEGWGGNLQSHCFFPMEQMGWFEPKLREYRTTGGKNWLPTLQTDETIVFDRAEKYFEAVQRFGLPAAKDAEYASEGLLNLEPYSDPFGRFDKRRLFETFSAFFEMQKSDSPTIRTEIDNVGILDSDVPSMHAYDLLFPEAKAMDDLRFDDLPKFLDLMKMSEVTDVSFWDPFGSAEAGETDAVVKEITGEIARVLKRRWKLSWG